jgi:hypothetical protein
MVELENLLLEDPQLGTQDAGPARLRWYRPRPVLAGP